MTNVSDLSEITHRFVTNTGKVITSCLDSGGYVIIRSLWNESFKTHFPLDGEGGKQHKKKKCQDKQLMGLAINGSVFVMKEIYICSIQVEMLHSLSVFDATAKDSSKFKTVSYT